MSERSPAAVEAEILRQAGFDPAASAGLFVGVSTFEDSRFHPVPFAVDDAVDLAHLFSVELGLIEPARCVLALAGEPKKEEAGQRLVRLLERGATRSTARQHDFYRQLSRQAQAAGPAGLFLLSVASHGVSDQGGDFLVAADSFAGRTLRTGVAVQELLDDASRARTSCRLLFLDACRERLSAGTRGAEAEEAAAMAASFAQAMLQAKGQVLLAGSTLGGFAYDDLDRGNGVFTGAVLDGLRGRASVDERGFITARTLADFVEQRVIEWVKGHRPEHATRSFGIMKQIEGPADSLPLAIDPERSRALKLYQGRRAAALARLRENLGPVLSGAHYDQVVKLLPEKETLPEANRVLAQIEALDGGESLQRSLRDLLGELLDQAPPAAPAGARPPVESLPRKETPTPAPSPRPSPPRRPATELRAAGSRAKSGRRWLKAAAVAAGLVGLGLLGVWVVASLRPEKATEANPTQDLATTLNETRKRLEDGLAKARETDEKAKAGTQGPGALGMTLRYIPAGTYTIGSPKDEPGRFDSELQHEVRITRGFWLGETEVTQAQWGKLVPQNPSFFEACGGDCPVENVSWYEAAAFANLVSESESLSSCYELSECTGTLGEKDYRCQSASFVGLDCPGYRLPTEAEWETAARAGAMTALYTGKLTLTGQRNGPELDPIAWYGGNSGVSYAGGLDCSSWPERQYPGAKACGTHPVGRKAANAWGLYDMLGNVWEWVGDWQGDYPLSLAVDPPGPSMGSERVFRGGSWIDDARDVRLATRLSDAPNTRHDGLGFRLARGQGRSSE